MLMHPDVNDARLADLFETEEVGNAGHVDLGKIQMFFFTVVLLVSYAAALSVHFASGEPWISQLPMLNGSTILR